MAVVMRQISSWTKKHPVLRGMITYSILWPTSNICQQVLQERKEINFYEAMRFSLFGCFYVGPTLYTWVKISSAMFPGTGLKIALKKVLVEQFLYSPFAISSFYIGMGLLEGKSLEKSLDEMKRKFFPTYRTGLLFWPVVQTINFSLIKESNRVPFASVASFFWAVFLSYMKHRDQ